MATSGTLWIRYCHRHRPKWSPPRRRSAWKPASPLSAMMLPSGTEPFGDQSFSTTPTCWLGMLRRVIQARKRAPNTARPMATAIQTNNSGEAGMAGSTSGRSVDARRGGDGDALADPARGTHARPCRGDGVPRRPRRGAGSVSIRVILCRAAVLAQKEVGAGGWGWTVDALPGGAGGDAADSREVSVRLRIASPPRLTLPSPAAPPRPAPSPAAPPPRRPPRRPASPAPTTPAPAPRSRPAPRNSQCIPYVPDARSCP